MAFKLFSKLFGKWFDNNDNKNALAVSPELYDAPFEKIMASVDPLYLEDSVAFNFSEIIKHRSVDEFRFFRLYKSWMDLVGQNLEDILYSFSSFNEFKTFLSHFPEHAEAIYEFLLDKYLHEIQDENTKEQSEFVNEVSIVDDLLIPMSDLERYQAYHFSFVRKRSVEILDCSKDYAELWCILQTFEAYFDMPREYFEEYVKDDIETFIQDTEAEGISSGKWLYYDVEDMEMFSEFFMDEEAYYIFMDNLKELLNDCGFALYSTLIKIIGPVKELTDLYGECAEFKENDE